MKLLYKNFIIIFICFPQLLFAQSSLKILSTTSTRDSGFYSFILPFLKKNLI